MTQEGPLSLPSSPPPTSPESLPAAETSSFRVEGEREGGDMSERKERQEGEERESRSREREGEAGGGSTKKRKKNDRGEDQEDKESEEEISKIFNRMKWESEEQCKSRQLFLHKVIDSQRGGCICVEDLKWLSCLYYNVKFLHCTYDRALLQKLYAYDETLQFDASPSDDKRKNKRGTAHQNEEEEVITS